MDHLNVLVQEAIAAVKAGRKQEARDKLLAVIEQNNRHEQAWLGLSALVEDVEERRICLENVLEINPTNERAKKELAKLGGQAAPPVTPPVQPPAASPRSAPPAPPVRPVPSSPPVNPSIAPSDPFGDSAFDTYDPSPELFDPYQSSAQDASPFGGASFDGFESASGSGDAAGSDPFGLPAYHGSGQEIDATSPAQYDQWMSGLNLDTGMNAAPGAKNASPFGSEDSGGSAFGSSPFESGPFDTEDAFGSTAPAWNESAQDDAFGESDSPWDANDSPFDTADEDVPSYIDPSSRLGRGREPQANSFAAPPAASPSAFGTSFDFGQVPTAFDDDDDDEQEETGGFDFDDDFGVGGASLPAAEAQGSWAGQDSTSFSMTAAMPMSEVASTGPQQVSSGTAGAVSPSAQKYFQQIPADIEAVPSDNSRQQRLLMAGVVVLLVLNVASIGLLVM